MKYPKTFMITWKTLSSSIMNNYFDIFKIYSESWNDFRMNTPISIFVVWHVMKLSTSFISDKM